MTKPKARKYIIPTLTGALNNMWGWPLDCCGVDNIKIRNRKLKTLNTERGMAIAVGAPALPMDDGKVRTDVIDTPAGFITITVKYEL